LYVLIVPVAAAFVVIGLQLARGERGSALARRAVILAPVVGGLLHAAYVTRVGGDFMHARFLLPDTFALMMPAAVLGASVAVRSLAWALTALVLGWALVVVSGVRPAYTEKINERGIANERTFWKAITAEGKVLTREDWAQSQPAVIGARLRRDLAAGKSYYLLRPKRHPTPHGTGVYVATHNLGMLSVAAGNEVGVIDMLALSDGVTSHLELPPDVPNRVGHAVRPEAWRLARYAAPSPTEPAAVADARAALRCGDLAVLQEAITGEMTMERFWANLRLAPRLTFFTVPADPTLARQQVCPNGAAG
ncbi:MAG: hypothetical protein Q4F67_12820, partial [Propionibacteriaceae bacterium]|nr:hypothetical protein [Propionibacteriaceae bacterium]